MQRRLRYTGLWTIMLLGSIMTTDVNGELSEHYITPDNNSVMGYSFDVVIQESAHVDVADVLLIIYRPDDKRVDPLSAHLTLNRDGVLVAIIGISTTPFAHIPHKLRRHPEDTYYMLRLHHELVMGSVVSIRITENDVCTFELSAWQKSK